MIGDYALEQMMDYDGMEQDNQYDDDIDYQATASGPGICPKCGSKTEAKVGKFGKFYGCTNFPLCTGSRGKK